MAIGSRPRAVAGLLCVAALSLTAHGQIMLSGNETKIDLTHGGQKVIVHPDGPDSLTLLDFSTMPPKVVNVIGVPNSVIGPPSNIAFTPDGKLAIISNSIRIEPAGSDKYVPESYAHIVDMSVMPPKVVGRVKTGMQPSGISITPDGKMALIADRADGTVTVLSIDGKNVTFVETIQIAAPTSEVSDVAITPDGKTAFASVKVLNYLAVLNIAGGKVTLNPRKITTFGGPYRVVVTPDGKLAVTAGHGAGNGPDEDCVTIVDLTGDTPRAVDYVKIGPSPESFEISPDGKLLAAVVMNGSSTPAPDPQHSEFGMLTILKREGNTFVPAQRLKVGPIPEGVAFTPDGKHLAVQSHPTKKIWLFDVDGSTVKDSGVRIDVPGMPSSLRAVMTH